MKVGPVSARFGGRVTLSELGPPNGYRISGEGEGGVAGFAKGGSIAFIEPRSQRLFTSLVAVAVTTSIRRLAPACSLSLFDYNSAHRNPHRGPVFFAGKSGPWGLPWTIRSHRT
jgi:hypothetical protein